MKPQRNIPPKAYFVYDSVAEKHALPWADFPARQLLRCCKDFPPAAPAAHNTPWNHRWKLNTLKISFFFSLLTYLEVFNIHLCALAGITAGLPQITEFYFVRKNTRSLPKAFPRRYLNMSYMWNKFNLKTKNIKLSRANGTPKAVILGFVSLLIKASTKHRNHFFFFFLITK